MPHVTFIHGIANKPASDVLLQNWRDALAVGGLDLADRGVTSSMVYWADVMYAEPEEDVDAFEAVEAGLGTDAEDEDMQWVDDLPRDEAAFVARLRGRLDFDRSSPDGDDFAPPPPPDAGTDESVQFEAVPLPWFIKRRVMKRLLRDVHHYLFNSTHSPRPGDVYQVQDHIRGLFLGQLGADANANSGGKHIVVSHSMGTVIAYDCLKNVPACPSIDGYMTVGSPLGISEVYDNLKPNYSRHDGFPSEKVADGWVNVFDRLDPVALDARLANDYKRAGVEAITDEKVKNRGRWRHSSWKYLGQSALTDHLKALLGLSD